MSGLADIRITTADGCGSGTSTHNVLPLLHQIRHALAALIEHGEPATIDLGALPLTEDDAQEIETTLGRGEVTIQLDALGPSEIRETGYPGVWWVTHYNGDGDIMARFIEVTHVPAIVGADSHDIRQGLLRLADRLDTNPDTTELTAVAGNNPNATGE